MGRWMPLAVPVVRRWPQLIRGLLVIVLAISLTACGGRSQSPDAGVIEQAVAQQIDQTQQILRRQLAAKDRDAPKMGATSVRVSRAQRVILEGQPAYRVQGTYRLKGKYLSRAQMRSQNPFDIYLQSQDDGQSWQVVQPERDSDSAS